MKTVVKRIFRTVVVRDLKNGITLFETEQLNEQISNFALLK